MTGVLWEADEGALVQAVSQGRLPAGGGAYTEFCYYVRDI